MGLGCRPAASANSICENALRLCTVAFMKIESYASPDRGPHFGLTLELGAAGDDERFIRATSAFWRCPLVTGPWREAVELGNRESIAPAEKFFGMKAAYGLLTARADQPLLPFALYQIREGRDSEAEPADWLTLGIPVAALPSPELGEFSWSLKEKPWLVDLCRTLAVVASHVHGHVRITAGAIGEEISGCWRRPTSNRELEADQGYPPLALLSADAIDQRGGFVIPDGLWEQLGPSAVPELLSFGLRYAPPLPDAELRGA
jgi:hypothetical protein